MRYIFVSDIHGCYDKLMTALEEVEFNKEKDTIVNVGDSFDRGPQSLEVLEFLMSCPHRILIWGNHDWRLREIILTGRFAQYDFDNGVPATLKSFTHNSKGSIEVLLRKIYDDTAVIKLLWQYFNECFCAVEWSNLIATHGWLPYKIEATWEGKYQLLDYRNASREDWDEAFWCHTEKVSHSAAAWPNKPLLIGHWHAWRLAQKMGLEDRMQYRLSPNYELMLDWIDCSTYIKADGTLIAIDGCSNYEKGGKVNAYVFETNEEPSLIYWTHLFNHE